MDLETRNWSRQSVYLTKDSKKLLEDLAYFLRETQAYALNKLIQDKVPEMIKELVNNSYKGDE